MFQLTLSGSASPSSTASGAGTNDCCWGSVAGGGTGVGFSAGGQAGGLTISSGFWAEVTIRAESLAAPPSVVACTSIIGLSPTTTPASDMQGMSQQTTSRKDVLFFPGIENRNRSFPMFPRRAFGMAKAASLAIWHNDSESNKMLQVRTILVGRICCWHLSQSFTLTKQKHSRFQSLANKLTGAKSWPTLNR